jgi:NTE family protein
MSAQPTLREWLASGPFALTMSSGFFGFYAHTGMLSALLDAGLAPSRVSGSSAGGMIAALWASGVDPERMRSELMRLSRPHFWDPGPGLGVLRGQRFRALLESLLPVSRIEASRVPVALSVFDVQSRRTEVLREGELAAAIHATCAVPLLFQPVRIGARHYLDGGILDRPGIAGMPSGERVLYHHLTSRSPWRRKNSPALRIPERTDMVALALADLPRASPFALEAGRRALAEAYQRTRGALEQPLAGHVLLA